MTLVHINLTGFISLFLVLTFSPDRFERVLEPSIFSALLTLIKKVSLSTMENFSPKNFRLEMFVSKNLIKVDTHCLVRVDLVIKSELAGKLPGLSLLGEADHLGMPLLGFLPRVAEPELMILDGG